MKATDEIIYWLIRIDTRLERFEDKCLCREMDHEFMNDEIRKAIEEKRHDRQTGRN